MEIFRSLGTYDGDITHSLEAYVEMIPRLGSLRGQYSVRGDDFRFSRPIHTASKISSLLVRVSARRSNLFALVRVSVSFSAKEIEIFLLG